MEKEFWFVNFYSTFQASIFSTIKIQILVCFHFVGSCQKLNDCLILLICNIVWFMLFICSVFTVNNERRYNKSISFVCWILIFILLWDSLLSQTVSFYQKLGCRAQRFLHFYSPLNPSETWPLFPKCRGTSSTLISNDKIEGIWQNNKSMSYATQNGIVKVLWTYVYTFE